MSQTANSSSIPNLEEGLKWVGSSIIRFFFPYPFSFSEASFLFLDFGRHSLQSFSNRFASSGVFCFSHHPSAQDFIAYSPFPFSGGMIYRFSNSWFWCFLLLIAFFVHLFLRFLPCSSKRCPSFIFVIW